MSIRRLSIIIFMVLSGLLLTFAFDDKPVNNHNSFEDDPQVNSFIKNMESLVLNTTDQALLTARNVLSSLERNMPVELQIATHHFIEDYTMDIKDALEPNVVNFIHKRQILRQYKTVFNGIEYYRKRMTPMLDKFESEAISKAFVEEGKNTTKMDNLYMKFMHDFDNATKTLLENLKEVKDNEKLSELLKTLEKISSERNVYAKDKGYDEFIENYLFQ